ncbi:23782_t:CDS:2, partial [Dentiscutata erythropus]
MLETQYFKQQDGSKIAYKTLEPHNPEDIKNEIPLVLIIGLWCVKEEFICLEEVIIFDNRGMGESSVVSSDDPISLDLMAQDTIALVKHLGIKKFNLLGWSMGGFIVFYVALNVPSNLTLEKLIICSRTKRPIMNTLEKCFTDYMLENPEILDKLAEIQFNSNRPFEIFNIVSKTQMIKTQTLLLHGEADEILPIVEGEFIANAILNLKFIRIPNAGH